MQQVHNALRKDTDRVLEDNRSFFQKLSSKTVDAVYSYGFSYSDIDKPYIKKICTQIDHPSLIWNLQKRIVHDPDIKADILNELAEFKKIIHSCGFSGVIATFN